MTVRSAATSRVARTVLAFALAGCGEWAVETESPHVAPPDAGDVGDAGEGGSGGGSPLPEHAKGLHAVGGHIEDAEGNRLFLRGANRSGTEYKCIQGGGFFDGPDDDASIAAMASWGLNAVRVPLNETCWLAINGAPARYSGQRYKDAIVAYVERLHRHGLIPILDLHWSAPGTELALGLTPMPNVDHSVDFWRDVAATFRDDDGVILEPFNEPFPDLNRDTQVAWACWRDGCDVPQYGTNETFAAVGMQALVDAIRDAGSSHLILLGGIQYSNALSQWLAHKPNDPLENLGVAWHVYNNNACRDLACWGGVPAELAATIPVVATEIGQNDCTGESFLKPLMQFIDEHASGYLAWSWNVSGECQPTIPRMQTGQPWSLITDYESPEPNSEYARTFYDHVQGVVP